MHQTDLIITLTVALAAALCFGYVSQRLRLSPIVGYLVAGIAVGGHTPGLVADQHLAEQLAEVGVILLMFGVGLHFHWQDLLEVRRVAVPGAVVQSLAATALGAAVAVAFGWSVRSGIVFGMAIAVASTVVLTRVLVDNRALHTPTGHVAIGWLVVEDLFTVLMLVLLPALFGAGAEQQNPALALGFALAKIGALVAATLVLGGRWIPRLFARMAATDSRELFTLCVLVTVLGVALGATKIFGVSMALGAFLAGMVVGKSDFSLRAASDALPMRDAFSVLFFVSVGMLLHPATLVENLPLIGATLAVVVLGKALVAFVIVLVLGYPVKTALGVSVALAQIGEFSFILAATGRSLGIVPNVTTDVLVATAIVSITINPLLYRLVDPVDSWIMRRSSLARLLTSRLRHSLGSEGARELEHEMSGGHAIIVGFGPVGQTLERLLGANGVRSTVVELNHDKSVKARDQGTRIIYGDARQRDTLEEAGIRRAGSLILSASSISARQEIIRHARELNPDIRIIARTNYVRELAVLQKAGVGSVFSGEGEVALAMVEDLLRDLGATDEQIDRERRRARAELWLRSAPLLPKTRGV